MQTFLPKNAVAVGNGFKYKRFVAKSYIQNPL